MEENEEIVKEVIAVDEIVKEVIPVDYSEVLSLILEQQTEINLQLSEITQYTTLMGSSILSYSIVYIPLVLIILALWWFFKQFIR